MVNSSSIVVQWSPSKGSLVSGYNVTYMMASGGTTQHVLNQRNIYLAHLVNLHGMTTYRIKVGLVTINDETIWTEEVSANTPQGGEQNVILVSLRDFKLSIERTFAFALVYILLTP